MQGRPTLSGEVSWEFSGHLLSDLYHRRSSMRIVLDVCLDGRKLQFPTGDRVDIGVADGRSIQLTFHLEEHGLLPGVHEIAVRAVFVVPLSDSDAAVASDRAGSRIGKDCFDMGFRRCRAHVLPESTVQFYYVPLEHPKYQQEIDQIRAVVEGRRFRYEKAVVPSLNDNRQSGQPEGDAAVHPTQSSQSSTTVTATTTATATAFAPDDVPASMSSPVVSVTSSISTTSSTAAASVLSNNANNHSGGTPNANGNGSSSSAIRGHQGGQGHLFAAKGLTILSPEAEMRLTMPADMNGSNTGAAPVAVVQLILSLPRRLCLAAATTGGEEGKWSLLSGTLRLQVEHSVVEGSGSGSGTVGVSSKRVYDTTQIALDHFHRAETPIEENAEHTTADAGTTYISDTTDIGGNFVVIIDIRGLTIGTHAITAAIVVAEPAGVTPLVDGNTVLYSDAIRFVVQE